MLKTELSYNPYLRETIVKFNGQEPRINSLVEKYQNGKLQDWTDMLPCIFHDEMNGYDFEFIFSGVETDFNKIKTAFKNANVPEESVVFFYKNELESPMKKRDSINELFQWLEEHQNRRFSYDNFKEQNTEVLDSPYSFITVGGGNIEEVTLLSEKINADNADKFDELLSIDLTDIPVVVFIESSDNIANRKTLKHLVKLENIKDEQLFFCVDQSVNKAQTLRMLTDLGIKKPKIVTSINDPLVEEFFRDYSLTDHIKDVLDLLRANVREIQSTLDEENAKSKIINTEVHAKIDTIEQSIERLKIADNLFVQRDNLDIMSPFRSAVAEMNNSIFEWRKKKIKTTNKDEAEKMAVEFRNELEKIYNTYVDKVDNLAIKKCEEIEQEFDKWFKNTQTDPNFKPVVDIKYTANQYAADGMKEKFLSLKTEQYVDPKGSIFNLVMNNTLKEKRDQVLEVTYTYEIWRKEAANVYNPMCEEVIEDWTTILAKYYVLLAEKYHEHIMGLIKERNEQKVNAQNQLSGDEKILQEDNDWLTELKDKLYLIERG